MSRVYVTPQAGRPGKAGAGVEADEWGKSASQLQFRGYEPAEMRNVRSTPSHQKELLKPLPKAQSKWHMHNRAEEAYSYLEPGSRRGSSHGSGSRKSAAGPKPPGWELVHRKPIPERPFLGESSYVVDQEAALEARRKHFPNRDESVPRSKTVQLQLALARLAAGDGSEVSTNTRDSASAYTLTDSRVSGSRVSGTSCRTKSSFHQSASAPSLAPSATSSRVEGGIAKRRKEIELRAPSQWDPDRRWFMEKWEKDGPAGMAYANYAPSRIDNTLDKYAEAMNQVSPILHGRKEPTR